MKKYILKGRRPVEEPDLEKWARWFEASYKNGTHWVARTEYPDGSYVSTIFLGIDHSFQYFGEPEPAPILFETMILGPDWDHYQRRCSTYGEAIKQHVEAVAVVDLIQQVTRHGKRSQRKKERLPRKRKKNILKSII